MEESKSVHIALIPSPGMGHLIPLLEFAKRLINFPEFTVTFIIAGEGPPTKAQRNVLDALPSSISTVYLPPADLTDLPLDSTRIETRISLTITRSNPMLRKAFGTFEAENRLPVALVVDLFGTDAFDVAKERHVSPYIFFPSTANMLSFFLHLPKLDETVSCEFRDLTEPVKIPGCVPVTAKDLLDPVQDRKDDAYKWLLHNTKRYKEAQGIIINSFIELEPNAIKALQEPGPDKPPVYPIGPLVNMTKQESKETNDLECLKWLDNQPIGSVLYVSFGSGGTLTRQQLNELALGLADSEQRFLWIVRSPSDLAYSSYFDSHSKSDPLAYLPPGFLDQVKGKGFIIPSWAPQAQILAHPSTGGFLSHCGWNSTLESVVNGVPIIAWPLFAEQKMNAVSLTEEIGVAIRVSVGEDGIVKREEVTRVVKGLMEGEEGKSVRSKMKEMKEGACRVLKEDGSSTKALTLVAEKWKSQPRNEETTV